MKIVNKNQALKDQFGKSKNNSYLFPEVKKYLYMKSYQEMNEAEKKIMDYLQVYSYQRINSRPTYEKTDTEIILEQMARELGLID